MKAIVGERYGSADVLELKDVDAPRPGNDDVLVRVRAAGLDRGVWHLMTGLPYLVRLGFGLRTPRNPVLGMDVAGTVEAVGADVTGFAVGDAVFGIGAGTFAELACVSARKLAPKPASLSFEEAAAVPISGGTALQAVRDQGEVTAGQRVLVTGASGGVGTFAVQIASALGAEVTGVASGPKLDRVRALGAQHVVDYRTADPLADADRYDVIVDVAGNRRLRDLRRALVGRGTLVIVGGEEGGRWFGGVDRQLRGMLLSPFVGQRLRSFIASEDRRFLAELSERIDAGAVRPVVDRTFALADAADAMRYLVAGRATGKVVVTVP